MDTELNQSELEAATSSPQFNLLSLRQKSNSIVTKPDEKDNNKVLGEIYSYILCPEWGNHHG